MIEAQTNIPFEALTEPGFPTGLVGTITVQVYDPSTDPATTILAPTTAGITEPAPETYRVLLTVTAPGTFRVRWEGGDLVAEEDLVVTDGPPMTVADARPTVAEIAALERARTYVGGELAGTFNDDTRPTAADVEELIDMAVGDVAARAGVTLRPGLWAEARRLAAVQAAALIESSFFPEQIDSDQSAFRQYSAIYLAGVQALAEQARQPSAIRLA